MNPNGIMQSYKSLTEKDAEDLQIAQIVERVGDQMGEMAEEIRRALERQDQTLQEAMARVHEEMCESSRQILRACENRQIPRGSTSRSRARPVLLAALALLIAALLWPTTRAPIARALLTSTDQQSLEVGRHLLEIYPKLSEPQRQEILTLISPTSKTSDGSGKAPFSPPSIGLTEPPAPASDPRRSPEP